MKNTSNGSIFFPIYKNNSIIGYYIIQSLNYNIYNTDINVNTNNSFYSNNCNKIITNINNESNILNNIPLDNYKQNLQDKKPCGIINYNNNCYFNSGLQILVSCDKFVEELRKYKEIKNGIIYLINEAFNKLLIEEIYDPSNFINYFCLQNNITFGTQYCSQDFIRTIFININNELINNGDKHPILEDNQCIQYMQYIKTKQEQNEFQKFIKYIQSNNNFLECKAIKLFSGLSKYHSYGKCKKCGKNFEEYSFNYFVDQNIYLDNMPNNCNFSYILEQNLGNINNIKMKCPNCIEEEVNLKEEMKIIKFPEILIFTLERYRQNVNNIIIVPDETIDITNYLDNSIKTLNKKYEYELFAINLRFGETNDFGHEICQVKRNGVWFEMNDTLVSKQISSYNKNSYGLFYQRKSI